MAAELDRLGRVVQQLVQAHTLMTSARNEPAYSTGRRESVSCDSMRPSLVADESPKRRSMDDGLMLRPWLPIEQQDSRRPKCEPRAWDDTHTSEGRFSPSGPFSHQTLPLETFLWKRFDDAASEHGNSSLPVDPTTSSDCQITSTSSFAAEDLLVAVREEQDGSQGIGITSRTDVDVDDPALMDMDDAIIDLGTFLTDDHTHLIVSSETHMSALGTSTSDMSQILPCAASRVGSYPASTTTTATRASAPCTRPCNTDIGKDDCFKALSACSVSPEKKEISTQLPPTSVEPTASNHKPSSEIKQSSQLLLQTIPPRKSRKRKIGSTAAELQKKNEAEKKRIKKQADVVARLRDELALHTDRSLFDPHGISRNDLLEKVLEQLIKNRQSYCALPYVVSNDLHRGTRHMYTNVGPH